MSELNRVAVLTSHMMDLKERVDNLIDQRDMQKTSMQYTIDELTQTLWETEAALGDAERELVAVKNMAVKAIQKLGECVKERDSLRMQVGTLQQERSALNSSIQTMQQRLKSMTRRRGKQMRIARGVSSHALETTDEEEWESV